MPTLVPTLLPRYDVIVVGARCAGAASAMLLARRGLRVLAVDRGARGTDTLSTHALMRMGVFQLARWSLLDRLRVAGTPPVPTTAFHYPGETVELAIKPRDGVPALYAPRRTVLDSLLVEAALEQGAHVRHGLRVEDLLRSGARVRGVVLRDDEGGSHAIECDLVIGADGLRSTVAALVGAPRTHCARRTASTVYTYWSGLATRGYHWYFGEAVSAGAIPTNDGLTCVFAAMPPDRFAVAAKSGALREAFEAVLRAAAPELAAQLRAEGSPAAPLRGFAGTPGYLRRSHGPGWALVGDAGYFKDPITAHGISDALRDASLVARAAAEGTPAALDAYEATRDALSLPLLELSAEIASFEWTVDELKGLHLRLSREMNRELEVLASYVATEPDGPGARTLSSAAG